MNQNKATNGNDAETTRVTTSRSDFPAKCSHTEFPGLAPTSQSKPAKYTAPSGELSDSFKVTFGMGQANCEGAKEQTAFRECTSEYIYEIEPAP